MTTNTRQESAKQRFYRLRLAMALAGALAAIMLLSACSGSESEGDTDADAASGLDAQQVEAIVRTMSLPQGTANGGGIHANGSGVAIGEPDIAVLNVGVQAIEDTVTEARNEAALAIGRLLTTLGETGVADDDIETLRFNVQPRYEYEDNVQTLTGYQVTNSLSVTIRNLDNVGTIIDGAVAGGGDAARIDSIRFEVEDGTALEDQARRLAIADAIAKADLYAELTGVSRGTLMSISESSFSPFPQTARVSFAMAEDAFAASAPTQVIAGEFEVRIDVQATFGIE